MKSVVSFDIDGVLADFTAGFTDLHAYEFSGRPWSCGAQKTWLFDLPQEEVDACWDLIRESDVFWLDLPPLLTPGEVSMMNRLHGEGVEFVYVTNRDSIGIDVRGQTEKWLAAYDLPDAASIYVTSNKAETLAGMPLVVGHIEDSPSNIRALQAAGLPVVIRDWQYNRDLPGKRAGSVAEFLAGLET